MVRQRLKRAGATMSVGVDGDGNRICTATLGETSAIVSIPLDHVTLMSDEDAAYLELFFALLTHQYTGPRAVIDTDRMQGY